MPAERAEARRVAAQYAAAVVALALLAAVVALCGGLQ